VESAEQKTQISLLFSDGMGIILALDVVVAAQRMESENLGKFAKRVIPDDF
jgi:hypothetical protein